MKTVFLVVQHDTLCESTYTLPVAYTELEDARKRVLRELDSSWPELSYAIREVKLVDRKPHPVAEVGRALSHES